MARVGWGGVPFFQVRATTAPQNVCSSLIRMYPFWLRLALHRFITQGCLSYRLQSGCSLLWNVSGPNLGRIGAEALPQSDDMDLTLTPLHKYLLLWYLIDSLKHKVVCACWVSVLLQASSVCACWIETDRAPPFSTKFRNKEDVQYGTQLSKAVFMLCALFWTTLHRKVRQTVLIPPRQQQWYALYSHFVLLRNDPWPAVRILSAVLWLEINTNKGNGERYWTCAPSHGLKTCFTGD